MRVEPVVVINGLITLIEAILALAVGFGLNWTPEQVGLVVAVVVAFSSLITTLWTRSQVTPVANPRNNERQRLVPELKTGYHCFLNLGV